MNYLFAYQILFIMPKHLYSSIHLKLRTKQSTKCKHMKSPQNNRLYNKGELNGLNLVRSPINNFQSYKLNSPNHQTMVNIGTTP